MICENIEARGSELYFAGQNVNELAEKYGTPLYIMDEDRIRHNCRVYAEAFRDFFGADSYPLYASKANSFKRIYKIAAEEGMGIDVVSGGEIYTAVAAGFDMSRAYFHSNNKSDEEIVYAIKSGVGFFVVDNTEELEAVNNAAGDCGIKQNILLRITPGIDPHTYEAINTGKVDSKFGFAIETGQAERTAALALEKKNLALRGFHCHVGSQVFEEDVFERSAVIMLGFCADMKAKLGYDCEILDLGGGYGVRYVESDAYIDIRAKIASVAETIKSCCERLGIKVPSVRMEPGRSIVADAGMTLYTVGNVKSIPGYKNYVSVDGGMTDNPRFALYGARYTCLAAGLMDRAYMLKCSVVGRCCESGDIIQENVLLPAEIKRGDILAVCTTGAYNYSMASHYNRIPKPAMLMLSGGENYLALRRETYADLCNCEID